MGQRFAVMNKEDVKQLYSSRANLYHVFFVDILRYSAGMRRFFQQHNEYLRPGIRVLDAGCGGGAGTIALHKIARENQIADISFQGFDLTPPMLERFKLWIDTHHCENIEVVEGDVLNLRSTVPDHWTNYDLIISSAMLDHIPKPQIQSALENLGERLKSNGVLAVFITRNSFLMKLLIEKWWHANMYRKDEILNVFQSAGFKDIQCKKFPFPYNHLNLWGFIIEAKAP